MKLDDFLKRKKVRCINRDNHGYLTENKVYDVIGAIFGRLKIRNDNGDNIWYDMTCFKLVIESAENPLQGVELTPETEASEPKFKVGDRVYVGLTGRIVQVTVIIDNDVVSVANKNNEVRAGVPHICHATQENYERLQATFTDIEFERPSKELKGSDLARAMLERGDRRIYGYASDNSDNDPHGYECVVRDYDVNSGFGVIMSNARYEFFNPCDPRTGEPLTEAVFDD